MTLLNLVKQIANDVADLKVRMTKLENRLDNLVKLNNLKE
jgi:hypothetical protein